ncbi:AI-2E family transporter [Oerskovia enterophila]|uniref:Pheromone autoinducer 2 transporter n=1 Tax=Oerskovia enterophila TaxID=43678 RepID=A0A163T170_9CELL|nr:AI-2E family transporter [Oerskovia enterophila]KZM36976.1 pheromone autoinducer 2 transporter [Oerskovia enterophila]OCI32494.1 pheromone autoinducer 2 transporter [Oerskovia enterophila]
MSAAPRKRRAAQAQAGTPRPTASPATAGAVASSTASAGKGTRGGKPFGADAVPPSIQTAAAWSWRLLLIGALVTASLYVTGLFKVIVVPVAIALLLTVLLTPVRGFLQRHLRFSRGLASISALLGMLLVVAGLVTVAGSTIVSGIAELKDKAIDGFNEFMSWLESGPFGLGVEQINGYLKELEGFIASSQDSIVSGALGAATTVGHVAAGAVIALFCTFFFLLDGRTIWSWCVGLFPARSRDTIHQAGRRGIVTLSAYARTQILVALVDAVGIGVGAAFFVPSLALPLGILVFVGSFIPIVGAVVTGAVAVLVVLVANGWVAALIMLGIVLAVQQIESHALQPFLMGHAVSLHPVAVLLVVAAGGFAAGIVGALFAVPLAALINTVVLYFNGHDKFPDLGTDDTLVIRGEPVLPVMIRRAEADLADDEMVPASSTPAGRRRARPGRAAPSGTGTSAGEDA